MNSSNFDLQNSSVLDFILFTYAWDLRFDGITVGFTRAAGLVKELPPQEQLQARAAADFKRR